MSGYTEPCLTADGHPLAMVRRRDSALGQIRPKPPRRHARTGCGPPCLPAPIHQTETWQVSRARQKRLAEQNLARLYLDEATVLFPARND